MISIRRVDPSEHRLRPDLCALLKDTVHGGGSIGFLAPLSDERANTYWDDVWGELASGKVLLLVAEEGGRIVGTIQLAPCRKENAPHRAEVQKLFVLGTHRGRGISRALLGEVESVARSAGHTTLVLDTEAGSVAEAGYQHLGWQRAGEIPAYARTPSGKLHPTVYYYKLLD